MIIETVLNARLPGSIERSIDLRHAQIERSIERHTNDVIKVMSDYAEFGNMSALRGFIKTCISPRTTTFGWYITVEELKDTNGLKHLHVWVIGRSGGSPPDVIEINRRLDDEVGAAVMHIIYPNITVLYPNITAGTVK